jgi:hypothetical protein
MNDGVLSLLKYGFLIIYYIIVMENLIFALKLTDVRD